MDYDKLIEIFRSEEVFDACNTYSIESAQAMELFVVPILEGLRDGKPIEQVIDEITKL